VAFDIGWGRDSAAEETRFMSFGSLTVDYPWVLGLAYCGLMEQVLPLGQNNFPMYVTLILDILDPLFKII
jgi:hypothetical protein